MPKPDFVVPHPSRYLLVIRRAMLLHIFRVTRLMKKKEAWFYVIAAMAGVVVWIVVSAVSARNLMLGRTTPSF